MVANIIILVMLIAISVLCFGSGVYTYREYDERFSKLFVFLGLVCVILGIVVAVNTTNIALSQGTYNYKNGTYTVYTDNAYKTYDVDSITDKVGNTGLTTEEFEKKLKDKGITERK